MRTTLDIPENLIEEARQLLGFKSKTDTVVLSLQELIRRRRIEQLKSLMGAVNLEIDLPRSRRRLWSLDSDFRRMAGIGLVEPFVPAPPGT
jgi:Arc/MetJ family transcription regulator